MKDIEWEKPHILKIGNEPDSRDEIHGAEIKKLRQKIEPWLTAIFQSEHLSLLAGSGLTKAVALLANVSAQDMGRIEFENEFKDMIKTKANNQAKKWHEAKQT